jgi:hypothetical protein
MKKFALLAGYFAATPLLIVLVVFYSLFLIHNTQSDSRQSINLFSEGVQYRALPQETEDVSTQTQPKDARIAVLTDFFNRYHSPLAPYAQKFVEDADKYKLDYRLLPAIAMQESGLCRKTPKDSNNCWGFGIYGKKVTRFDNYGDAIDTISKTLAQEYVAKGYTEPEAIMAKYTPSSNGSWAESVSFFMEKINASL